MEFRAGDELGVLHVHQVLLVIAFGGQLAVAEDGQLARLAARVAHLQPPDLMGRALRHVIQRVGGDARVLGADLGIGGAVAAAGLEAVQRLFHRPPAGGPEIAGFVVPQVDIAARLVELVEHIAQDAPGGAGLDEAVAAGVLRDDRAVLGRAQVVGPGHGRARIVDDVLPRLAVKMAVSHLKDLQTEMIALSSWKQGYSNTASLKSLYLSCCTENAKRHGRSRAAAMFIFLIHQSLRAMMYSLERSSAPDSLTSATTVAPSSRAISR